MCKWSFCQDRMKLDALLVLAGNTKLANWIFVAISRAELVEFLRFLYDSDCGSAEFGNSISNPSEMFYGEWFRQRMYCWLNEVSIQSYCGLEWCLNAAWKLFAKVQRQNLSILGLNAERCLRNNMLFVQWRQCVPWHLLPVVDWTRAVNCCLHMWRFCQCHLCTMRPSLVMSNECTHSIIQSRDLCPRRARQGTDVICIGLRAMA